MKMKITMLLALIILCACTAASAQEYYTLPEIREQAAVGWHETYTDKYGRTIPVDLEIDVFGEDVAPVLKVGIAPYEKYRVKENNPFESDRSIEKSGGKRTFVVRLSGQKIDLDKAYGIDYENDLTVREAYGFVRKEDIVVGISRTDARYKN
ncbi:MAG: hypothetical protein J6M47_04495 [Clostridia bacterium]|nr:hypothetical protein [Clostridia bacterium]